MAKGPFRPPTRLLQELEAWWYDERTGEITVNIAGGWVKNFQPKPRIEEEYLSGERNAGP